MAYVPPALRRKQEAAAIGENGKIDELRHKFSKENTRPSLPSIADIQNHFWPTKEAASARQAEAGLAIRHNDKSSSYGSNLGHVKGTEDDQDNQTTRLMVDKELAIDSSPGVRGIQAHSTLNGTEAEPDKLKYVLLFHNAHPRWKTDQIIYVKSDLHLLPSLPVESVSSLKSLSGTPLATGIKIFDQNPSFSSQSPHNARFKFLGCYSLTNLQLLAPNSTDLARMLEQKWTRTSKYGRSRQIERDAASWKKSLGYQWAVLRFEKDEEMSKQLGEPNIEVSTGGDAESSTRSKGKENVPAQPRRSVNEMLRDMRMKDEKKIGNSEEITEGDKTQQP